MHHPAATLEAKAGVKANWVICSGLTHKSKSYHFNMESIALQLLMRYFTFTFSCSVLQSGYTLHSFQTGHNPTVQKLLVATTQDSASMENLLAPPVISGIILKRHSNFMVFHKCSLMGLLLTLRKSHIFCLVVVKTKILQQATAKWARGFKHKNKMDTGDFFAFQK